MSFFRKLGSCWRSTATVAPVKEEQSVKRTRSSKSKSAAHWQPSLAAIVEARNGAQSPVKEEQSVNRTSSFKSVSAAHWRPSLATIVEDRDGDQSPVKEQSVNRTSSSKSVSAAHWRPSLATIVEDVNGAQSPAKNNGERKFEKETDGQRGRFMAKSYSFQGRDNYRTSPMPTMTTMFSPVPFMF